MLFHDRAKYLGLILGVAISILLINQQVGVFVGMLMRASAVVRDVPEATIWVMDPGLKNMDTVFPLRNTELGRVRGVPGVLWAVPFFKAPATLRTFDGELESGLLVGIDDHSLVGAPPRFLLGQLEDLRRPDAVAIGIDSYNRIFPGQPLQLGQVLELNDHRAVLVAVVQDSPKFTNNVTLFTRYSQALTYTNNGRRQMSFVVAHEQPGEDPDAVARRIREQTGLLALTSDQFSWKLIRFIFFHTGIPISVGSVVLLGVVTGICIVGLLFNLFVMENMRHFAMLKAIGATNRLLVRMVLLEAAVVAFVGYGVGMGLGAIFFEVATQNENFRGFRLPWQVAAASAALAVCMIVVSSQLVLRRVLRVEPAIVFRG
ncbi:MAG: ABC transporter permease [Planctomycetaceae bacterium]